MKQCPQCGELCDDGVKFCTSCGARFQQSRAATKKEFLQLPENAPLKKELRSNAIICYVCAGVTLLMIVIAQSPLYLLDFAIVLGMGLGIHLKQSKVCAVILCAYAVLNTVLGLINNGKFSGYLLLLAGIYSVVSTFKLDKKWKEYQAQGT